MTDLRSAETLRRVQQFRFSLDLFERNFEELDLFLAHLAAPVVSAELGAVDQRWRQHEAMKEVSFLLHDFVAAALSLIDHSRVFYREMYEPCDLIPEYQSEVDARFISDPLTQFIKGLRQMAQHYRLPVIAIERSFTNESGRGTLTTELLLRTTDLQQFGNWPAPAKAFLANAGDAISLKQVVRDYREHVAIFYEWFIAKQREVHGNAPAVWNYLLRHGVGGPSSSIVEQLETNIAELEQRQRSSLTFADLHDALSPALTLIDERHLAYCQHDGRAWVEHAITVVTRRFNIGGSLPARLRALCQPATDDSSGIAMETSSDSE